MVTISVSSVVMVSADVPVQSPVISQYVGDTITMNTVQIAKIQASAFISVLVPLVRVRVGDFLALGVEVLAEQTCPAGGGRRVLEAVFALPHLLVVRQLQ